LLHLRGIKQRIKYLFKQKKSYDEKIQNLISNALLHGSDDAYVLQ
jgi:hypothetical protein